MDGCKILNFMMAYALALQILLLIVAAVVLKLFLNSSMSMAILKTDILKKIKKNKIITSAYNHTYSSKIPEVFVFLACEVTNAIIKYVYKHYKLQILSGRIVVYYSPCGKQSKQTHLRHNYQVNRYYKRKIKIDFQEINVSYYY